MMNTAIITALIEQLLVFTEAARKEDFVYVWLPKKVLRFTLVNWKESVRRSLLAGQTRLFKGVEIAKFPDKVSDEAVKEVDFWSITDWEDEANKLGVPVPGAQGSTIVGRDPKEIEKEQADNALARRGRARAVQQAEPPTPKSKGRGKARFHYGISRPFKRPDDIKD